MGNLLKQEPAVIISTLSAFLTAVIGMGAAFGLDLTEAQQNAVIATVAPATALVFLLGFLIRGSVYSPASTDQLTDTAYVEGAEGETKTPIVR